MSNITITPEDRKAAKALRAEIERQLGPRPNLALVEDTDWDVIAFASARLSGHQRGVAEERERAAVIAERGMQLAHDGSDLTGFWQSNAGRTIAEAIRTPNKGEATTNITSEG